jgi:periplasmic protein TonB
MERPSHIIFGTHQSLSRRLPYLGLAASLQIAIFWLFTSGLGSGVIHHFTRYIEVPPIKVETDNGPKPPPIEVHIPKRIELPPADPPSIDFKREPGGTGITTTPNNGDGATMTGPTRAAVSIAATHTVPPYPVIARRVGWEGKVTLRLTVLTDGHVGAAEVVASSGRVDLDQTAQAWIVLHWIYRPALDNGAPTVSQALATVEFSLKDEPLK